MVYWKHVTWFLCRILRQRLILLCITVMCGTYVYHTVYRTKSSAEVNSRKLQNSVAVGTKYQQKDDKHTKQSVKHTTEEYVCITGNATVFAENSIRHDALLLEDFYKIPSKVPMFEKEIFSFINGLKTADVEPSFLKYEREFLTGESNNTFINKHHTLGGLLSVLKKRPIIRSQNAVKGTQLKLMFILDSGTPVIFKPKWYDKEYVVKGPVYAGKDRHFGEMIAFLLSILLDMLRVPLTAVRVVDVKNEILPHSDRSLLETFVDKENEICFYGSCIYCTPDDPVCTEGTLLEGVVSYYVSGNRKLIKIRHPWQRTYSCKTLARWETEENYCSSVATSDFYTQKEHNKLLLDLIDISIFDFLIDNGDRHHFEIIKNVPVPRVLIIDNGKSFGHPDVDHIDILAPLYQCCMLRSSTWSRLLLLKGGVMSNYLRRMLEAVDALHIFNEAHMTALERRLIIVFAAVKRCSRQKLGLNNVIVHEN